MLGVRCPWTRTITPVGDEGVAFVDRDTAAKESFERVVDGILGQIGEEKRAV